MDLLGIVQRATTKAFTITQQFQQQVTFQLQIVWNLDPIHDTANEVPTHVRTVLAVVYKPLARKIEPGAYMVTEVLCLQQWTDLPAPSINDKVIIPSAWGNLLRQIMTVSEDPAHAQWTIETRLPTKQ